MDDTITLRKLREMLRDPEVEESEIRPYVVVDEKHSRAFAPALCINPDRVDTEGLEGDIAAAFFNRISRKKRNAKYKLKKFCYLFIFCFSCHS